MALSNTSHLGQVYDLADGDQTAASLASAAGFFPNGRRVEVRCETAGPIAIAVRPTALTGLAQGKQLTQGENATFRNVDLGQLRIFAVGAADKIYLEVETF
jgi:hypothetical protein